MNEKFILVLIHMTKRSSPYKCSHHQSQFTPIPPLLTLQSILAAPKILTDCPSLDVIYLLLSSIKTVNMLYLQKENRRDFQNSSLSLTESFSQLCINQILTAKVGGNN